MIYVIAAFTFLFGFGLGSIAMKLIVHWVALLLAAMGRNVGEIAAAPKPGSKWPLVFAIIHPVPWLLLLALPYGIHRLIQDPPALGWLSFYAGIAFALLGIPIAVFIFQWRQRARAARPAGATPGGDNVA